MTGHWRKTPIADDGIGIFRNIQKYAGEKYGVQIDSEEEGNIAFRVQEGGIHSGEYANQYIYNGLCWF